jgi:hypothetical protein
VGYPDNRYVGVRFEVEIDSNPLLYEHRWRH